MRLLPGPGQRQDITRARALIDGFRPEAVIADKGCDAERPLAATRDAKAEPVIAAKANRKQPRPHGEVLYKERNLVERLFCKLKQLRRVAIRCDKLLANYKGCVQLAAIPILLK